MEWVEGKIAPNGHNKTARQSSLRKKIFEHRSSNSHKNAVKVLADTKAEALKSAMSVAVKQQYEETCKVFRTAYYIAKQNRPYMDHSDLVTLQQQNGIDMGRVLHSPTVCVDIIDHIAGEQRRSLINTLLTQKCNMSVLIDESTSLSRLSCLIVFVRAVFDVHVGPYTFFLDIVELSSMNSEGITEALTSCLSAHGFTDDYLGQHWIGIGVDGASVMLGHKSGVVAKLKCSFPRLISWHCFNHRLELSVSDAVKCCTEINHFKAFFDALYSLYSMSPKCQRELAECASELNVELNRIGRILDVRWVASSYRTVRAVWRSYEALHCHFQKKASNFTQEDSRVRAKFSGFTKKLENPAFIKNMGLMLDALEELSDLSLALQRSDINLPMASKLVRRQVEVFAARKSSESKYYSEACAAITAGTFKGIAVAESSGKQREIPKAQFYQALVDSISARLFPETEQDLCNAIMSLDPRSFASNMPPEFGEADVDKLCVKFNISFSDVKHDYREFKETKGDVILSGLRILINSVNTLPISTAECERGFSKMNLICSSLRSKLTVKHMSSLLFISICAPPVSQWEPLKYVKSWILLNRRSATCLQGPSRKVEDTAGSAVKSLWSAM